MNYSRPETKSCDYAALPKGHKVSRPLGARIMIQAPDAYLKASVTCGYATINNYSSSGAGACIRLAGPIVESIHLKISEQIERTAHLIRLVPSDKIGRDPRLPQGSSDVGHLLGHLLDCMAGFCAVFHAAFPQQFANFSELQSLPVNHFCRPEEAVSRIREYAVYIGQGFDSCTDNDLPRVVPSVFVPQGEPLATLLLGNLEHLINHKYQLFFYLKLLGIPVTSRDIYLWRGTPASPD